MRSINLTRLAWAMALGMAYAGCHTACASDETELNKRQARRVYEEGLSRGIFEVPYTANFVGHGSPTRTFTHADGMKEAQGWRNVFPDLVVRVDRMVAENDMVSVHWTARGTNTGEGMGIPATGKSAHISGQTMFRFENGKIAEEWTSGDALGLMRQLGLLPSPGAAQTAGMQTAGSAQKPSAVK